MNTLSNFDFPSKDFYKTEKIIRNEKINQNYFKVLLEKFKNHEALFFIGCKFYEGLIIENIQYTSLRFKDCDGKDLVIYDYSGDLELDNSPFKLTANLKRSINKLTIKNYSHGLYLRHPEYIKVNQPGTNSDFEIKINTLYIRNVKVVNLRNFTIQNLYLDINHEDIESFYIESCRISNFIIRAGIQKLEIINSIVRDRIYILTHQIGELEIHESNFKNSTLFFQGKANKLYKKFEYSNTLWFKKILENDHGKESIALYRHFKGIGKSKYDDIMNYYFNAREYDAIRKSIKWKWPWNKDFWDKLMLSLNSLSNYHGIYWQKALIVSILFTFLSFVLYSFISGYYEKNGTIPFYKVFEFYLPTHKFNFMLDRPTFLASFIDFVHRIFNSYLIYQLIAAFRRYKG